MSDNITGEAVLAIDESVAEIMRTRRSAGESLKALAGEIGLTWQRLWTLLYSPAPAVNVPALQAVGGVGPLTEKYRPTSLDAIWGQEAVVKVLRKFAAAPYSTSFIFEGETGTGKTSAALALAAALGCDVSQKEFGGVYVIASGEQTADTVREIARQMWNCPFYGSGWKVVIVNEADRMHVAAETIWLDRLETLPPRTVVMFTTNYADRLPARFRDRCTRLVFESDAGKLRASAMQFAAAVWKAETGHKVDARKIEKIVSAAEGAGQLGFRRVMQELTVALGQEAVQ